MRISFPLCVLLLAFSTLSALGQSATVEQLQLKAKAMKVNKEILIGYDKFGDKSIITTKPWVIDSGSVGVLAALAGGRMKISGILMVSLTHEFAGKELSATPETYLISFMSGGSDWQFLKGDRRAYIIYDDRRLVLDLAETKRNVSGDLVMESLSYPLTKSEAKGIASAKVVEFRLGETTAYVMKPEIRQRFRKMLDLLDSAK